METYSPGIHENMDARSALIDMTNIIQNSFIQLDRKQLKCKRIKFSVASVELKVHVTFGYRNQSGSVIPYLMGMKMESSN